MFREEAALWSVNQGGYNIPDMNLGGGRDAPMPIFGEEHNPYGLCCGRWNELAGSS